MEKKNKGEFASAKHEPLFFFCILLNCKELTEKHFPEAGGQADLFSLSGLRAEALRVTHTIKKLKKLFLKFCVHCANSGF